LTPTCAAYFTAGPCTHGVALVEKLLMHVVTGNAADDGTPFRGWFVGHFMPPSLANTRDVEIKWGTHRLDEIRPSWAVSERATTLSILLRGRIRLLFETGEHVLAAPGDYALWGPGVAHRWHIEADDTVILTVRWPSLAGDAREH
jgi:hypothetical protein